MTVSKPADSKVTATAAQPDTAPAFTEKPAPLQRAEDYRLWVVRHKTKLVKMGAWDEEKSLPIDTSALNAFIVEAISDTFLEQVMDTDLKASTIWKHLATLILKGGVSAQSTALLNLMNFSYPGPTMLENQTSLMGLCRALRTAFNNAESIEIDNLVTLFALVNMPSEHQPLRTTLEETKKDGLTLAGLFESLIREEATLSGTANRASRAKLASADPGEPGECPHNRPKSTCWKCTPESRPTCHLCKKAGLSRIRHHPDCAMCKEQRKGKPEAKENAPAAAAKKA